MVFSSVTFLFLFLPGVLLVYFLLKDNLRNFFLFFVSLFFYAWGEKSYVTLLSISVIVNYFFGFLLENSRAKPRRRAALVFVIFFNLALLGFYKYANFAVSILNSGFSFLSLPPLRIAKVHLPIGISFFTFHAISYAMDVYRGKLHAQRNPINMGLYITLFPQMIAGPIVRYSDVGEQIEHRHVSLSKLAYGIERFVLGLSKKMMLANPCGVIADEIFAMPFLDLTTGLSWLGALSYALQIYFDFSGYSDMAIGLGHMLGFKFIENFNYPYISRSIKEFWTRWHISLTTWFRDYLFLPLSARANGPVMIYVNVLIVFGLCGLWHGASWNFVAWGLIHGALMVFEDLGFKTWLARRGSFVQHAYVIVAVLATWVFFRSENMSASLRYLKTMAGFGSGAGSHYGVWMYMDNQTLLTLFVAIIAATPLLPALRNLHADHLAKRQAVQWVMNAAHVVFLVALLLGSMAFLADGTHNPFIYFRF